MDGRSSSTTFKREPLTQSEATELANACLVAEERLVIWTLLDTGLRVSELSSLTKDNIDWQIHRIIFRGKGDKRRTVEMPARMRDLLEAHIGLHESFNMSVRTIQRIITRVANRAKIRRKCTPHVLRHTFAVTSLRKGVSLPALRAIMGHSHLQTTAIYLNVSDEEALREFREKW